MRGKFTAWDGYIHGVSLPLEPYQRIRQRWRTTEFAGDAADSKLDVRLAAINGGTRLTLVQTEIPAGLGKNYKRHWLEHYFAPMTEYLPLTVVD